MLKYRKLFSTKDSERFSQYIEDVKAGKTDIKSGTLFPYDIVRNYLTYDAELNDVLEEQWKALPNYVEDGSNILVMADVSGSMTCCNCLPLASSVGLAIYFAERAHGVFHNYFMTFSAKPEMVKISGATLFDRVRNAEGADWQMNTDLDAAFACILNTAVRNNASAEDIPKALVIISDMQFDDYYYHPVNMSPTFYNKWKVEFAVKGYEIPNVIFWNVNSESDTYHADSNAKGVQLLSGHSASTFKTLIQNLNKTPVEAMLDTLNSERYAPITVAE